MKIIDDHAHLTFEDYDKDLDKVISENKKAGVIAIISNGTDLGSNKKVIEIAKKYDIVKIAFGLHPTHLKISDKEIEENFEFIERNKKLMIAVGEVGLDFKFPEISQDKQVKVFERFIEIAEKANKPIIVHSRKAELNTIEVLESSRLKKVIMHYFCGRKHLVKRIIDNGWMLSIPTNVVRLQQLQDNVVNSPLSQILTETDCPFLSPFPDIMRNEPRFIIESLKKIGELKKLDVEVVSEIIFKNYKRLFVG